MENRKIEKQQLYNPVMATISRVETLTEMEKRFEIELPGRRLLDHKPGQFVEVSVFGWGEAPISVCSSPTKTPGFELTVRRVGRLTEQLHRLEAGSPLGIRGPYGNGFDLDRFRGRDILFVCAGIGLAPLKSLIDYTIACRGEFGRLIILYGTRHPSLLLFRHDLGLWEKREDIELHVTVDRPDAQWKGKVGVITTLIPPLELDVEKTVAAVVGPPVMYKYVLMALKSRRIPDDHIFMSLERRMKCGVGKCGHCQINSVYVCQEGPVFPYSSIKNLQEAI